MHRLWPGAWEDHHLSACALTRYECFLIHHRYVGILILGALLIVFDRVLMIAVCVVTYAHYACVVDCADAMADAWEDTAGCAQAICLHENLLKCQYIVKWGLHGIVHI